MLMLVSKRWMIKQLDVKCAFLLLGSNTTGNLTEGFQVYWVIDTSKWFAQGLRELGIGLELD